MEYLCEDALLETIYKKTHVKPIVDQLTKQRKIKQVHKGRSYKNRVYRLSAEQLF